MYEDKILKLVNLKKYYEIIKIIESINEKNLYMTLILSLTNDIIQIQNTNIIPTKKDYDIKDISNAILSHDYIMALKLCDETNDAIFILLNDLLKIIVKLQLNELSFLISKPSDIEIICEKCNLSKEQTLIIEGLFICNCYINGDFEFANKTLDSIVKKINIKK